MANYAIFDEQFYLASYPWVKPAIDAGVIQSGREHFERFGREGGLTKVSRYFDENTYLTVNSDIRPFVRTVNPNGPFASGLDHFIQFGYEEGQRRSVVSPEYSEDFYLANNSELRSFIGPNAPFKSGYQHFIQFGSKEGRFGTSFFEPEYLRENPDIVPFVNSGALRTGREHYFNFGKNEPSRDATFVGTRSNDILTGVGVGNTELIGVEVGINPSSRNRQYESFGVNEFDVLIGSPGADIFVLGVPATAGNVTPTPLYLGNGQATIRNFNVENDFIQLQGTSLSGYNLAPVGNNLSIQTRAGDVLGVIEGGANLGLIFQESNGNGTFLIG
ncbi:MAG TPA: calcium-binding protein [Phormidium sp.]